MSEAMVAVEGLSLNLRGFALTDVSLRIERGEYFVLLGPTGCGKTLFLETLCGLRRPNAGVIHIGGEDVTHADPARRRIGYVPQDQALLPFKSVRGNAAFGLAARRTPAAEAEARVNEVLRLVGIAHLADRRPAGLSGGERQRVALARALAIEPRLLLLDEPLSAIDEEARDALIGDLRRVHDRLGATTLHVCHNLEEAMALADRVAILRGGRVAQVGTPAELLARPADLFVARFLRLRNLLPGEVRAEGAGAAFFSRGARVRDAALPPGPAVAVLPVDQLRLSRHRPPEDPEAFTFTAAVLPAPPRALRPELRLAGPADLAVPGVFRPEEWPAGATVYVSIPRAAVHVLTG